MIYPLDHELVPPHRRATPEEVIAMLGTSKLHATQSNAKLSQLPCLRSDDPIAQYLSLKPDEVVRIDRLDGSVYYRVIVKIA
jgi:DNA-directed RNA polymerase subunit H (RpoH/RPB5)